MSAVRVRFAPSPTGLLHVGNVRAALVNWLYARQTGGSFILRLDDTDAERSSEEFADAIREDLEWLGLGWDESFKQSERLALYDAAAAKLREAGRLYPCYETAEELDTKRKIQRGQGRPPVYDRAALELNDDDRAALESEGRRPHWRFRLEVPAVVEFEDLIRGPVHFDMGNLSDPVLLREDGSYLYMLPSVVDDMDMGITHVVRGEDHVTNSAVQVQIFAALGGHGENKTPEFAHFSLLTSAEGEGLSKRGGAQSVRELREEAGLEPMALLSLLAHIGTSEPIEPFVTIDPLIEGFDFGKFARNPARFDPETLDVLNARILHATPFEAVRERLELVEADETFWLAVRGNLKKLSDASKWWKIIYEPIRPLVGGQSFMIAALVLLPKGEWDENTWKEWTNAVKEETGRKGKDLFMPLRTALTGRHEGPEMKTLLPLIGRERAIDRLQGKRT